MAAKSLDQDRFFSSLSPFLSANRWLVAFSGGVDSQVLLHLLSQYPDPHPPLVAIHVNHQLDPSSEHWSQHCAEQCEERGIELITDTVTLEGEDNLEARARDARYKVFEDIIKPEDVLFMGHHSDDQVETFFIRLLRGAGSRGLSAIPQQRSLGAGILFRPLLDSSRSDIVAYAQEHGLTWVDDPSNQQDQFDRNFLRLNVLPTIAERWPGYSDAVLRALGHAQRDTGLLDDLAAIDLQSLDPNAGQESIAIEPLLSLSPARRHNVIRYWLLESSYPLPTEAQLHSLERDLLECADDAEPVFHWAGSELRRFDGRMYVMKALQPVTVSEPLSLSLDAPIEIAQLGQLSVIAHGGGSPGITNWQVRFRKGGERCQPAGRAHSQLLKKLFQEYRQPPWLRDRTPLIYQGDEMVAVAGLWVCQGYEPEDYGYRFIWQPH